MHYELYVDRFFFLHFAMNLLLLVLTAAFAGLKTVRWKLTTSAAAGSFFFLAVFLWPLGQSAAAGAFKLCLQAAGALVMLQLAFGFSEWEGLFRAGLFFGTGACGLAGILAVWGKRGGGGMGNILLPAAAACAGFWLLARRERRRRKNHRYAVWLREGEKSVALSALMDSGNSLFDPVSGQPVCVVERELAERLGLTEKPERFRLIPYHTIGKKHGLMEAWAVETMYIQTEGQKLVKKRVLLAAGGQRLSAKGNYQMLLHPALLEEKKGEPQNYDIEGSDAGKDAV